MFKTREELSEITRVNSIIEQSGFDKILNDINNSMEQKALQGKNILSVDINSYVEKYMSTTTLYEDVSEEIKQLLLFNGYTVIPFSEYKECSLKIQW